MSDDVTPSTATAASGRIHGEVDFAPGSRVGRFVVLGQIGAGGMGMVFKAYDPELDRHVAIKILRRHGSDPARLLREAQAIARLSHPNVVSVHDVGWAGEMLYVAMEFVEGVTLRRWLQEPRSTDEILDVFAQVGRGLAAGHAREIVHRDVKPSNALVGDDGVVRVLDFGLARWLGARAAEDGGDEDTGAATTSPVLEQSLTATGSVIGTPRYMAPEQFDGETPDARADQFSFCVSLHEAIAGEPPFAGDQLEEIVENARAGRRRKIPAAARCPRWLDELIARGTAAKPADRFPSMDALVAELTHDRRGRVRRAVGAGAVLVAVGAAVAAFSLRGAGDAPDPCAATADAADEVWTAERRDRLRGAFTAAAPDEAEAALAAVGAEVEDYLGRWRAMRADACEANKIRGEQSDELFDRRVRCLDRRLGALRGILDVLADDPKPGVVEDAADVAAGAPDLAPCADTDRLLAIVPPPEDPEVAARVDAIAPELDRGFALLDVGRLDEALALANRLLEDHEDLPYPVTVAEIHALLSAAHSNLDHAGKAEEHLRRRLVMAAESHDDAQMADTLAALVYLLGGSRGQRTKEALALVPAAEAMAIRAGDDEILGKMWGNTGIVHDVAGNHEEALRRYEKSLEAKTRAFGADSYELARVYDNMAAAHSDLGDEARATELILKSLAVKEKALGESHPRLIVSLLNLTNRYLVANELDEALATNDRVLGIIRESRGEESFYAGYAFVNRSDIFRLQGIEEQIEDDVTVTDEFERALAAAEKARAAFTATVGENHEMFLASLKLRGQALSMLDRHEEALADFTRALALAEEVHGPEDPAIATYLFNRSRELAEVGRTAEAVANAERALRIVPDDDAYNLAHAWFSVARALAAAGGERRRALALARRARAYWVERGEDFWMNVNEIDEWLAEQGAAP